MKNTTTLDYIILGLIQQQPLSGYKIRKTFEDTALGNFGGSPGTIYPALNRMEKNKLIEKLDVAGSSKSNFSITESGLAELRSWLTAQPSETEVKKNPELLVLKFAFMDPMIPQEQKLEYLETMKYELKTYLNALEHFFRKEKNSMPLTGRIAFKHGLLSYRTSLEWCELAKNSLLDN